MAPRLPLPCTRTLTAGLHVAIPDHEHGVHFHFLGALDFAVDLVGAVIDLRAHMMSAQFVQNRSRVIHQRRFIADGQDAHLFRREPEREIPGVMLDEKADEPLVRAERRAMNAERRLVGVVAVLIEKIEIARRAKSTWFVASVNSRPMTLQTCTSIFGP